MKVEKFKDLLEKSEYNRIEFPQHFYEQARKRNIDTNKVKDKIQSKEFIEVRENHQSDKKFDNSYIAKLKIDDKKVEIPIYFNVPGPIILVKSIWPR